MELPHSKTRQNYIEQVKVIETNLKDATSGKIDHALLSQAQKRLDALASKYQYSEEIGTARYKLYELQALVHFFKGDDDAALDFINQAIEVRGDSYARAEKLEAQLLEKGEPRRAKSAHRRAKNELPLQLQALIRGQRSSAIVMAVLSVLSIYFSPWAIFYIILAAKLKPEQFPSRGLIKAAAIATLPLCLGIIPIIIDIEFWKMNKKLREYEELGDKAFISDKEWLATNAKHSTGRRIAKIFLVAVLVIVALLIAIAIIAGILSRQGPSTSSMAADTVSELKSDNTFTLPQKVDDVTDLIDVTADGNTIQYHYILHDADTSNVSDETLRSNIQPKVCSNSSMKTLLDNGVSVEYLYSVQGTNEQYSFRVTESDC